MSPQVYLLCGMVVMSTQLFGAAFNPNESRAGRDLDKRIPDIAKSMRAYKLGWPVAIAYSGSKCERVTAFMTNAQGTLFAAAIHCGSGGPTFVRSYDVPTGRLLGISSYESPRLCCTSAVKQLVIDKRDNIAALYPDMLRIFTPDGKLKHTLEPVKGQGFMCMAITYDRAEVRVLAVSHTSDAITGCQVDLETGVVGCPTKDLAQDPENDATISELPLSDETSAIVFQEDGALQPLAIKQPEERVTAFANKMGVLFRSTRGFYIRQSHEIKLRQMDKTSLSLLHQGISAWQAKQPWQVDGATLAKVVQIVGKYDVPWLKEYIQLQKSS